MEPYRRITLGVGLAMFVDAALYLAVLGLLALPKPETPSVGVVPWPLLLLLSGAVLGMLFAGLARWWARRGNFGDTSRGAAGERRARGCAAARATAGGDISFRPSLSSVVSVTRRACSIRSRVCMQAARGSS